jgi:CRP/FNR family nitrogen fixation transcriptional regulator
MDQLGVRHHFQKEEEIYAQDEEAEMFYRVLRGVVRSSTLAADGRRMVGAFHFPGDLIGFDPGPLHRLSAEALTDCEVQVVRRKALRAAAGDIAVDRAILEATSRELARLQDHMVLLGRRSARERVANFLLSLAQRVESQVVEIPMTRQDMADYLGLTMETVSRMIARLQGEAIVEFPSQRRFQVRKRTALESLAA